MLTKEKILELLSEKGKFTTKDISLLFNVSRQYANKIVASLIEDKKLVKFGSTRASFYVSTLYAKNNQNILLYVFKKKYINKNLEEHIVLTQIENKFPHIKNLPVNIFSIFNFAFSAMFNNAIEHSRSETISVEVFIRENVLSFIIEDNGIGVFRNIKEKKNLISEKEAVLDLLKGKTTTMPKSHSGEEIFLHQRQMIFFC